MNALLRTAALVGLIATPALTQSWLPSSPYPSWGSATPARTINFTYDGSRSSADNGESLRQTVFGLQPGDKLLIGGGRYTIDGWFAIRLNGSSNAPIWIEGADPNNRPTITRSNANQNTINIGSAREDASYVAVRNLEVTGGADLMRLFECNNIWIDNCYLHDGGGLGIAAQTFDTSYLYITNNEITRPGPGTLGEGMYFGQQTGQLTMSYSVIAFNHVHHLTSGTQGDGIEIKQGSHHNWIVGNHVHDTGYPCILVYGTGGNGQNVIERNLCYRAQDNVMQVQGDALVINNVAIDGGNAAFWSHNHVATSTNLQVVHNTFISDGMCARLEYIDTPERRSMLFANNACYSRTADAIWFAGRDTSGGVLAGNVTFGTTNAASLNSTPGTGLSDFENVTWNASQQDVRPVVGGPLDNRGTTAYTLTTDFLGGARSNPPDPGAMANATSLAANTFGFQAATGGTQRLTFSGHPSMAGQQYLILGTASGINGFRSVAGIELPFAMADGWTQFTASSPNNAVLQNTTGNLNGSGDTSASIFLPPLPSTLGGAILFHHAVVVWDSTGPAYVSNPVPLALL